MSALTTTECLQELESAARVRPGRTLGLVSVMLWDFRAYGLGSTARKLVYVAFYIRVFKSYCILYFCFLVFESVSI